MGQSPDLQLSFAKPGAAGYDATFQQIRKALSEGDLQGAEATCARLLETAPERPEGWHLGARLAEARGETQTALERALRAFELTPTDLEGAHYLARLCFRAGHLEMALAALEVIFKLSPGNAEGRNLLGMVHYALGDIPFAESCFRACLQQQAEHGEAWGNLGLCHRIFGRWDEAMAAFEQATALRPDSVTLRTERALTLDFMGRSEDSLQALDALLDEGVRHPRAVAAHARVAARAGRIEDAVADIDSRPPQAGDPVSERAAWHFAAAEVYDRAGRYEEAFQQAHQANALSHRHYDAAAHSRNVDALIEAFSPEAFATLPQTGVDSELPVFIVGMPRSGSTLLERVLAAHPQVASAGEHREIGQIVHALPDRFGERSSWPQGIVDLEPGVLDELAHRYLDSLPESTRGAARVADKMPGNFEQLGLIALMFPNARIVHTRRNPLDTCLSCYLQSFAEGNEFAFDLANLAHYYGDYSRLMRHWMQLMPDRILEVDYESLVADLDGEARRVLAFCGLDWDPAVLAFHAQTGDVTTASYHQVRQPLYSRSAGRWRNYAEQLAPLAEALRQLGAEVPS